MKLGSKKGWKSVVPLRLRGKSATRFCLFPKVKSASFGPGNTPVYLNVYDLTPMNGYVYWAGLGIFHSGVEVHGVEYAFGAHDYPTSGVFEVEPRQCPGFKFRKSIFVGTTCLDLNQVREFMERHSASYNGDTYHLIVKNCNHFCKDICYRLTGNPIPKWVNRLAKIGSICNCILPEALKITAVRHDPGYQACDGEKRRLTNAFSCLSSISMRQRQLSTSSLLLHSPLKGCLPPWELRRSNNGSLKDRNPVHCVAQNLLVNAATHCLPVCTHYSVCVIAHLRMAVTLQKFGFVHFNFEAFYRLAERGIITAASNVKVKQ